MATDSGRHSADDDSVDRARIEYLAGETDLDLAELSDADRAELDDLRSLLADPALWSEPPAQLEESVVVAIAAEASQAGDVGVAGAGAGDIDAGQSTAPVDLTAARQDRQDRQARSGRSRFRRPVFLVAAAAAVAAVALTTVLLLQRDSDARRFDVALAPTELLPGASGSATMLRTDSGWEITLQASGLPRLDNGQYYQGWLRNAEGVLVPIGTFNEGTDVVLWAGVSPETFATFTITRESADGNQDSSGERVLVGTAVEQ